MTDQLNLQTGRVNKTSISDREIQNTKLTDNSEQKMNLRAFFTKQIGHLLVYATECDVSLCNSGQIGLCTVRRRMPTKTFLNGAGVSAEAMVGG